jgi:O-antigen/teichoic acid export membrane protein
LSASRTASPSTEAPRKASPSYASGARILAIGIASTGLLTFAYFSVASHVLDSAQAKRIDVLWSVMFVIISVIYRPVEQLLSRSIAGRRARGHEQHQLRAPMLIQATFALLFAAVAAIFHEQLINNVFEGSTGLYVVLIVGTLAYAASYFARGWLAGHQRFGLFGGLVLMESLSRFCFALAVAIGLASGENAVALGIAAAPLLSLVVVPAAFLHDRRGPQQPEAEEPPEAEAAEAPEPGAGEGPGTLAAARPAAAEPPVAVAEPRPAVAVMTADEADAAFAGPGTESVQETAAHDELSLRRGGFFAVWVSGIMLAEQTLLNGGVLTVDATSHQRALAGIVFNVLLIARAPLQLFQAVQTSLLPHLTGLEATAGHDEFARAVRTTIKAIAAFAGAVALGLLILGPWALGHVLFGQTYSYGRWGLALIGIGMGFHLCSGALNQAALARNRARAAATCWLLAACVFIVWMLSPLVGEEVLRAEIGYAGATAALAGFLFVLYRRHGDELAAAATPPSPRPGQA